MQYRKPATSIKKLCFIAAVVSSLYFAASPVWAIDIIAHPSTQAITLTSYKARAIFGGRIRSWPNGIPLKVFMFNTSNNIHKQMCREILNIFPRQLRRAWDRQIYSGITQGPFIVNSEDEMLKMIRSHKGAIGYIFSATSKEGVNVIDIK